MDRSTSTCNTTRGEILLLFHHFFAMYLYLGAFFFDPFIHLIVATLTIIHWYTYEKCILTEYTNIYCGVDIDRPFHDYIRMLKIYKIMQFEYKIRKEREKIVRAAHLHFL